MIKKEEFERFELQEKKDRIEQFLGQFEEEDLVEVYQNFLEYKNNLTEVQINQMFDLLESLHQEYIKQTGDEVSDYLEDIHNQEDAAEDSKSAENLLQTL